MTKKKESAASSPREQLVRKSESDIRKFARDGGEPSPEDLIEVPALSDEQLAAMRPVKEQLTIRLDADVLSWLQSKTDRTRPGSTPYSVL